MCAFSPTLIVSVFAPCVFFLLDRLRLDRLLEARAHVIAHLSFCLPCWWRGTCRVCTQAEIRRTEAAGGWRESWRALAQLAASGAIRARGASNVELAEVKLFDPPPLVVQNWFDPFRQVQPLLSLFLCLSLADAR